MFIEERKLFIPFFAFLFFMLFLSCGEDRTRVLAKVGRNEITRAEFEALYRPAGPLTTKEDSITDRKKFLDELIEKKVLSMEAKSRGFEQDSEVKIDIEEIKKRVILNELYNREVVKKTEVTEAMIRDFYAHLDTEIHCRHILVSTEKDAKALLDSIRHGVSFEELAKRKSIDEQSAKLGGDLGFFKWGTMVDEFQDVAFRLKVGEVSRPVKTDYGVHIIQCVERKPVQREPYDKMKDTIKRELLQRAPYKQRMLANTYVENLRKRAGLTFDNNVVSLIVSKTPKPDTSNPFATSKPTLLSEDEQKKIVLRWRTGKWTAGRLLSEAEKMRVALYDTSIVKGFSQQILVNEFLLQQAKSLGVDRTPRVKKEITRFKEEVLAAKIYKEEVERKITVEEEDIKNFYDANPDSFQEPEKVRVSQIVVSKKEDALKLKRRISNGEDFAKIAKEASIDKNTSEIGGDIGFVIKNGNRKDIEDIVFSLKEGEVGGPKEISGSFFILKVTEKKPKRQKTLDEVRGEIQERLRVEAYRKRLYDLVSSLKNKYKVEINEKAI